MNRFWWKESVVYQIYPKSFYDSNGDGIGDLQGIIAQIPYIDKLGVDIVWLNPIFQSPNDDNGYDISDYQAIDSDYGTMADFTELLDKLHEKNIRLVLDMVLNHTSDEHPWFQQARRSVDNPYRDFYIWKSGKEGNPPNNWTSFFGKSAWKYDELTQQFYLHIFSQKMPDLNWENPRLREKIYAMLRWWLEQGVDGFRLDSIGFLWKDPSFPDGSTECGGHALGEEHYVNQPKVHTYLQELHEEVFARYPDRVTMGELFMSTPQDVISFTGSTKKEIDLAIYFDILHIDMENHVWWSQRNWSLKELKKKVNTWQQSLHELGWCCQHFNSHDQPRSVSRFGDDKKYWYESASMLAVFLFTLEGTPFIFQGEEIGMTNPPFSAIEQYRDINTLNFYLEAKEKGRDLNQIMELIRFRSRDNSRTPLQWNHNLNAGFTSGQPWLEVNPDYLKINVDSQLKQKNSLFHFYRQLILVRKKHPALIYGSYVMIMEEDEEIFAYLRNWENKKYLVILNYSPYNTELKLPDFLNWETSELVISNYSFRQKDLFNNQLQPYEACVYLLKEN
ncbi:MAG: alpha-glucosidase [Spirochaetes bacterium]|nr:alpha-glucosidase [Spirochaetota bacterium]